MVFFVMIVLIVGFIVYLANKYPQDHISINPNKSGATDSDIPQRRASDTQK